MKEKQSYIRFKYAGLTWMWPVEGDEKYWSFAIPVISSEEDSTFVLTEEDIDDADDNEIWIEGEDVPYTFIKGDK
jgi:hypothetical protein